jgi:hypothetical protein
MTTPDHAPSRGRLLGATGAALVVAAIVVVTAVLPAEYGVDPLGTGRALGLLGLYSAASADPAPPPPEKKTGATSPPRVYKTESTEFTLGSSQGFEYKYRLEKGAGMVYAWKATGRVKYEFHGQPDDYTLKVQSYEKQERDYAAGSLAAPFDGIHGWYWENAGAEDITITLTTSGFYTSADEMRPRFDPVKHKDYIQHIPHDLSTPAGFSSGPQ